jgi:hypothetical protein
MTRRGFALLASLAWLACLACFGCSSDSNTLTGSMSQMYDLSFDSVNIILQGTSVAIKYVGSSGDPAVLVVDIANIANVAGSSIDLTQLDSGQRRGVLQRVATVTTDFPLQRGTVVFNQVPQVGSPLSGHFATTLSNPAGYTLDGDFSATVSPP